ncbi:hypothetical protein Godav_000435 [Gossypium davidsonii]|uniref:Pectinesterase inhibitor domain-containing protein n=2 Tax=Gossypium TaxID=3633 RepID=A0A7J8T0G1_GOSDV|nr:hypothetical protein [Gossypium davidsonii]MBA0667284.1 hypothetical protein [Gossypium klotzschianum]
MSRRVEFNVLVCVYELAMEFYSCISVEFSLLEVTKVFDFGGFGDCLHLITFRANKSTSKLMRKVTRTHYLKPRVSAIQTWVSATIMDEYTCMDGFSSRAMNGYAKMIVKKRIVKITHLTSNALALINDYVSSQILH